MRWRIAYYWWQLRASYWFVPMLMTFGGIVLAVGMMEIDTKVKPDILNGIWWIYQGGSDGARTVLAAVAGSVITVAALVFSITVTALQLASQQFGPRLLRNFMRDLGSQIVLGTFTATEIYSLMVLRTIHGGPNGDAGGGFVPHLAVSVGVLLAVASMGVLIYFIHHIALMLQAPQVIANVATDLFAAISELYPDDVGEGAAVPEPDYPDGYPENARAVPAPMDGYLQVLDDDALIAVAERFDLLIRVEHRPGRWVVKDTPIAPIWPSDRIPSPARRAT